MNKSISLFKEIKNVNIDFRIDNFLLKRIEENTLFTIFNRNKNHKYITLSTKFI